MSPAIESIVPGGRVAHRDFGEGVVVAQVGDGFVRCFFASGERQVPVAALTPLRDRTQEIIVNTQGEPDRNRRAWLAYLAHRLPLLDSAASLTSAKIDLLPHQVVLVHRVATKLITQHMRGRGRQSFRNAIALCATPEQLWSSPQMKDHSKINVAALKDPVALIPGTVNHLSYAKELFDAHGYATAKAYAESYNEWPRFAAWLEQQAANTKVAPKTKRGKVKISDRRQDELGFTAEPTK